MAKLDDTLKRLEKGQKEILVALKGDDLGNKGIIPRVEETEKYISKDRKQKRYVAGFFAGIIVIGQTAVEFLKGWWNGLQ